MTPKEALQRLLEGNARFISGHRSIGAAPSAHQRVELARFGQSPFAIVLACSDARVPAEIVFDCGLGDLFVVRVAGNIVAPSLVGSIEFAVENFATPLVLVLGHTQCGAVRAAMDLACGRDPGFSANIHSILSEIAPSVARLSPFDHEASARQVVERNVRRSLTQLEVRSEALKRHVTTGRVALVGGVYDLETGVVSLLAGPEHADSGSGSTSGEGDDGKGGKKSDKRLQSHSDFFPVKLDANFSPTLNRS